jgi:hypothetical protein
MDVWILEWMYEEWFDVYFMKDKSEISNHFESFRVKITQTGYSTGPVIVPPWCGGPITRQSNRLTDVGIIHEKSAPTHHKWNKTEFITSSNLWIKNLRPCSGRKTNLIPNEMHRRSSGGLLRVFQGLPCIYPNTAKGYS